MTPLPGEKFAKQVRYQKRHRKERKRKVFINKHHLTNRCKGGGNEPSNILYIRSDRHAALHKLFRNMSWEEIGATLKSIFGVADPMKCVQVIERISRMKGRAA